MRPTFSEALDFVIVREIARGAMGTVYEALQCGIEGFAKRVAIKVLNAEMSALRSVFAAEAHLVANLVHQNIVQTYHLGEVDGALFFAMELIEGVSLKQLVVAHKASGEVFPIELSAFIASRVARALQYAHTRRDATGRPLGVVHRDVCPQNVLISIEGAVKLTDFGVAKARYRHQAFDADDGTVLVGRARYMAPEQARLESTDARSDLYSLGVLLHELLGLGTEAPTPRRGPMLMPTAMINPEVPEALAAITDRAVLRDPAGRFQSAEDLGLALEQHLYGAGYGPTNLTLKAHIERVFPDLFESIDLSA